MECQYKAACVGSVSISTSQKVPVSSFKSELKSVSERMRCIFLLFVVLLLAMMVLPAEGFLHHIVGLIHHGKTSAEQFLIVATRLELLVPLAHFTTAFPFTALIHEYTYCEHPALPSFPLSLRAPPPPPPRETKFRSDQQI
ncbi:unnamed protein product [Gadus morhua 'NCC']